MMTFSQPKINCKCSIMLVNLAGVTTLNLSRFAFQTIKKIKQIMRMV